MALAEAKISKEEVDLMFFVETLEYIEEHYPFEIKESDLLEGALKGMLHSLDPYSDYYTSEEAAEVYGNLLGTFTGIGVYIEKAEEYIKVQEVMKGHPAEKSGMKKDDLIIEVDNVDIKNMEIDEASKLIRGPIDTKVNLKIKRKEEYLTIVVKREQIKVNPVEYKILEGNIGYVELKEFNANGLTEMKKALKYFDDKKVKKVILDIRNNPGGQLNQAIEITRLFVPKGPVLHIREKNKDLVTHISTLEKSKYKLVVLVNENSASASEILAGAIKDRKAGTLVGEKTYGKGVVQSLIPIKYGGILKLTISEYLTPNKTSINGIGIEPDIKVENTTLDLQLEKAIEILKKQ